MAQKPVNPANDAARTPSEEKLDQVLLNAARMLKTKSKGDVDTYFRAHSLNPDADGRIPAQITATSQDALPALQDLALKHGATIQTTFENRLFVMLPAAAIMPLAERSDVWTINVERATSRPR